VPDQRFDYLCDLHKPGNKIPAYLHVTDIAGLIKGASEGAGLGNAFLSHIAAVDGIFHLIRAFENDEIMHVDDSVDPVRDLETITSELCMKDLDTIERAIENERKEQKRVKVNRYIQEKRCLLHIFSVPRRHRTQLSILTSRSVTMTSSLLLLPLR